MIVILEGKQVLAISDLLLVSENFHSCRGLLLCKVICVTMVQYDYGIFVEHTTKDKVEITLIFSVGVHVVAFHPVRAVTWFRS